MRQPLVFEQSPSAQVSLPFFLVAPFFAVAAFILFAWFGENLAVSRWHGGTIAALHLFTIGYLLFAMMGAVLQMAPVLTGRASMRRAVAAHGLRFLLATGSVLFAFGLIHHAQHALHLAFVALFAASVLFVHGAIRGTGIVSTLKKPGPGRGILLAVAGFVVTAAFGLRLLAGHGWPGISLPRQWTDIHAGWAMLGWTAPLVMVAGQVVIPMFQHTRSMPGFTTWLAPAVVAGMLLATFPATRVPGLVIAIAAACSYAIVVLKLQSERRNRATDATVILFRGAMLSLLVSAGLLAWMMFAGRSPLIEFLGVAFFLVGFAGGCVMGMCFKIVPFLLRFHLQRDVWELGLEARSLPAFTRLLPDGVTRWTAHLHLAGLILLGAGMPFEIPGVFELAFGLLICAQAMSIVALWRATWRTRNARHELHAVARQTEDGNVPLAN